MTIGGRRIPMFLSLLVWFALWEIVGRTGAVFLIPPFTDVLGAINTVATSSRFGDAVAITFQAFAIGMVLALVVGIGVGFLMGRVQAIGDLMGMWANIFESSPLTAIVPALMALLGFGLPTMIVTVFLFSVWVIALDTQVGVAHVSQSLLEMGRSFGASRRQVLTKIVLFAALPELLAAVSTLAAAGVAVVALILALHKERFSASTEWLQLGDFTLSLGIKHLIYELTTRHGSLEIVVNLSRAGVERMHLSQETWIEDGILAAIDEALTGRLSTESFEEGGTVRIIAVEETALGLFARYKRLVAIEYRPPDPAAKPTRMYAFDGQASRGYFDEKGKQPYAGGWRSTQMARQPNRWSRRSPSTSSGRTSRSIAT